MSRFGVSLCAVGLAGCSRVISLQLPLFEAGESAVVAVERGPEDSAAVLSTVALVDLVTGDGLDELELTSVADDERVRLTGAAYSVSAHVLGLRPGRLELSTGNVAVTSDRFDRIRLNESTLLVSEVLDGEISPWKELLAMPPELEGLRLDRPDFCGSLTFARYELESTSDAVSAAPSPRGGALLGVDEPDVVAVRPDEGGVSIEELRSTGGPAAIWGGVPSPGTDEILYSDRDGILYAATDSGSELTLRAITSSVVGDRLYFMGASGDQIVALTLRGRVIRSVGLADWTRVAEFPPYFNAEGQLRYGRGQVVFDRDGSALVAANVSWVYRIRGDTRERIDRADPPLFFAEVLTTAGFVEGWGLLVGSSSGRIFEVVDRDLIELARFPNEVIINVLAPFSGGRVFVAGVDGGIGVLERSSTGAATLLSCERHGDHTIKFMTPIAEDRWILSGVRPPSSPNTLITEVGLRPD